MSKRKQRYTARDKSVQQMTRDGLVEKNLTTDEVNRISRRTGDQEFRHNTGISEELHYSSSFNQDLRPVHDSISPAKSHRPPSLPSHDDTSRSEPSYYTDTADSRTAALNEQGTFSEESALPVQTAGYSAEQNTAFYSHEPINIEETPSTRPPVIEEHTHSGSYHAEPSHSSFHTSKQIADENPSTFQTHSNADVFHQNREYGNYEQRHSSYRQSSTSGQETSPTNTSQTDQHRHRPVSRQNNLSDHNPSTESYKQDYSSNAPFPLSQEWPPYAPESSSYDDPAPQVQEETFSRSSEALPVSDMASSRSQVYQESNRQNPFSEPPHHAVPSSSTSSFTSAFIEQSHLSRYHQETERSTFQEKVSQNGAQEIHAEGYSAYQKTASAAPAESDNSTAQGKKPYTSHVSGYQASAEEISAPKDNGATLHHRGDSIEMTPIMTEVPAGQKLQESHFSGHFFEKVPDERFHIEKEEAFQSEHSHASSGDDGTTPKIQPSAVIRPVSEEKTWKETALASSSEIPSSPKDNGVVVHHRADHSPKEMAPVTTDTTSGTASPAEHKLQESHSAQHVSEKAPKDCFHTEKEVVLRMERSDTPDTSESVKPKSDRASPRPSLSKKSGPSAALSSSSDDNLSPPQKETSAVVHSASGKKHKGKAVKPASGREAPSPKDNGITLNHRMEKTEFSGSEKPSDFTRVNGKSAVVSEKQSSLQRNVRKKQIRKTYQGQRKKSDSESSKKTEVSAKKSTISVSARPNGKKSGALQAAKKPSHLKEKPPHSDALHPDMDGPVFTENSKAHRKKVEQRKKKPKSRLQEGDPKSVKSGSKLQPEKGDVKGKPGMIGTIKKGAGKAVDAATGATVGAAGIYLRGKIHEAGEENTGIEAAERTEYLIEQGVRSVNRRAKSVSAKNRERKKASRLRESPLENQPVFQTGDIPRKKQEPEKKNPLNRFFQKQRNKRKAREAVQKGRKTAGKAAQKGAEATVSITERAASIVQGFFQKDKTMVYAIIAVLAFIILLIAQLQSCSAIVTQTLGSVTASSWPADDQEITKAELYYSQLEANLQKKIDTVETTYPGYEEYNYNIGEIGHDPVALISYLCAKYEDFTFNDTIKQELNTIFNKQYHYNVKTENETRTVTKTVKAGDSLGTVVTSGYCNCTICCGQWSGGPTASGAYPSGNHTLAVDAYNPIVPIGTQVIMNGVLYTVEDTGNLNAHGVDFDVYYDSHSEALAHGHRSYEAYYAGGDGKEIEVTTTETVKVCYVTMTSTGLGSVLSSRLNDDQEEIYNIYTQSRGNRQFLGSPISGYWYSYISSHYGYRTSNGVTELHKGLDITPAAGTEILSVQDGTVSKVGTNNTYGKYIEIQNDDGYKTLYAHCSTVSVSQGQTVSIGDVIGKVGSSGDVSTATLHIEFQYEDEYYNPYFYLSCEGASLPGSVGNATGDAATLIKEAQKYLGTPYVWGGYSPSGFDCSGYVSYCLTNSGVRNTGHLTANGLLNICSRVSKDQLQPGDLVFFQGTYNTSGASHVGIYIGSGEYGAGTFIHCGDPCKYGDLNSSYWTQHWLTGGRWY